MSKILFILPTFHAGGTENYALRFINFNKEELEFHVLSLNMGQGDLEQQFIAAGAKIHYRSLGYLNPIKGIKFLKFLKSHSFQTICAFNGSFAGWALILAYLAGVPNRIAFYRRSTPAFQLSLFKRGYHHFMGMMIRVFATNILSNSEYAFQNFHSRQYRNDPRFRVIYNGVDPSIIAAPKSKKDYQEQFGIPSGVFVIGHIGRYDPAKNHDTIFKVGAKLKHENVPIFFLFCGRGTDSPEFKSRLRDHGIDEISCTVGLHDKIGEVLKSMDLFLFPSLTEGQPNALIEAMIADIPIIASDIPGIRECTPEYFHDKLINPLDIEGYSKALMTIISEQKFSDNRHREFAMDKFNFHFNMTQFLDTILNK